VRINKNALRRRKFEAMSFAILQVPKRLARGARRLFVYQQYDSTEYWKKRASEPGQAAVLWRNQEYNGLYRQAQWRLLAELLKDVMTDARALDIGCGIGVVAKTIAMVHPTIAIDAVDFSEMVQVARHSNADSRINYISSSAESYFAGHGCYDFIISSGCYSAIRHIPSLERALDHAALMVKEGGTIVMIDPFHRWNYLARAKYNSTDVIRRMGSHGLSLIKKSGILFWPYRELLANSNRRGEALAKKYAEGEWLLSMLGRHFWADYKILIFRK
jgi:2-polyprenyl-3-methyl-5-hydroxy-6-metoxy-1,4-benzoquinol methylase